MNRGNSRLDARVNFRTGKRTYDAYQAIAERLAVTTSDLIRYVVDMHVPALESLVDLSKEGDKESVSYLGPGLVGFEYTLEIVEEEIKRNRRAALGRTEVDHGHSADESGSGRAAGRARRGKAE
jgi:hypothetical protein